MSESQINSGANSELRTTNESSEFGSEFGSFSANQFEVVFARMMQAVGTKKAADVATALGISHSSVSGSKRRGNIPDSWYGIIADKYGVSMDWLRTGEGEMRRPSEQLPGRFPRVNAGQGASAPEQDLAPISNDASRRNISIADMLAKTAKVLESDTVYREALYSNIEAFHHGVTMDERVNKMERQFSEAMASFQSQLDQLRDENQQLRHELEESRSQSAVRDTG